MTVWLRSCGSPRMMLRASTGTPRRHSPRVGIVSFPPSTTSSARTWWDWRWDEYWSGDEQNQLGRHLDNLTDRPLFVHYTSGEWEGAKSEWVDGLIYQYGFGLSEGDVADRTAQLVSRLHPMGKTFIAGEYAYRVPEADARRLGAAALRAGADGVGQRHLSLTFCQCESTRRAPRWRSNCSTRAGGLGSLRSTASISARGAGRADQVNSPAMLRW